MLADSFASVTPGWVAVRAVAHQSFGRKGGEIKMAKKKAAKKAKSKGKC